MFALLSRHEPWGVVVNEAAACGLPLVLSDRVGAAFDLLVPDRNGALLAVDDHVAAGEAIRELAADPERRRAAGRASREIVASWAEMKMRRPMVPPMLSVQKVRRPHPRRAHEEADGVVRHHGDERVAELPELPLEPAELPRRALSGLGFEPLHRGLAVPAPEKEEQRVGHEQPEEADEEERRRIDAGRDDQQEVAVAGVEGDEQDRVVVDEGRRKRGADVRHDDEDADRHQQQREAATVELEGLGGLIGRRHGGRSVPACGRGSPSPVLGFLTARIDDGGRSCRA